MAIPDGWHYMPGSGRRSVISSDGERFTRAQAEKVFAQSHGFNSDYGYRQALKSEGFRDFKSRDGYKMAMSEAQASGTSKADANAAFANFYSNQAHNQRDRSPDGPLAKMLVAMGRRDVNSVYQVGDTPNSR